MSLDYNLLETIKLLLISFKYDFMISIIISMIIFIILLILNKEKKITKYIIYIINIILIIIICKYYVYEIIKFNFSEPINNIYFYFFNSIVYLIIMNFILDKTKYKNVNYIIYGICLINLLFSIFMTHYLNNQTIIVIGNIYPMIKFGNIIYIAYYIVYLFVSIKKYHNNILNKS